MIKEISIKTTSLVLLLFCLLPEYSTASEAPLNLTNAVKKQLNIPGNKTALKYKFVLIDLNNDNENDAVVWVNENGYCGSGGCTLHIYQGIKSGFKYISKSTITNPPIYVLNTNNYGWFTLIVNTGGIGEVLMEFNGSRYPLNPSVQPRATQKQIKNAKIILTR